MAISCKAGDKRRRVQLFALSAAALFLCGAQNSFAVPMFVYDGDVGVLNSPEPWYDINKSVFTPGVGGSDAFECWLAAGANILTWTGWHGYDSTSGMKLDTAEKIYEYALNSWENNPFGGYVDDTYAWWFNGLDENPVHDPVPGTGNMYPGVAWASLYEGYIGVDEFGTRNDSVLENIESLLLKAIINKKGTALRIAGLADNPDILVGDYIHSVTVWGMDFDNKKIYITDSDDDAGLVEYTYYQNPEGPGLPGNDNWYIYQYTNKYTSSFDMQIIGIDTLSRKIPEPTTLALMTLGLAGIGYSRKRKAA